MRLLVIIALDVASGSRRSGGFVGVARKKRITVMFRRNEHHATSL
jgi:hypothetical protein